MSNVTEKQAQFVLHQVAAWLGSKMYDDNEPAPTGSSAAYKGWGPELVMAWDWPQEPTPTIILESGYAPDEWAVACCATIQAKLDAGNIPVMVEPFTGYALCMYPK